MTTAPPPTIIEREPRLPLYVRVATNPPLRNCWSVNISLSGIGLMATAKPQASGLGEGAELGLEFSLPDVGSTIKVSGEVMWRHDRADAPIGTGAVALGVVFRQLSGSSRIELSRYLHGYRFHIGACFTSPDQKKLIADALPEHLHFADHSDKAAEVLQRGDVSVLIVGSDHLEAATRLIEDVDTLATGGAEPPLPRDLAPRIIYCGIAPPEQLVRLFNEGKIFRSLGEAPTPEALEQVVREAYNDYGLRTEQRRVALALERALLRERARTKSTEVLTGPPEDVVYASPAMERVLELARVVAPHKVAVLLQGETGTGKEVIARTIHRMSQQENAPFIVQDCGALTETLLESELFGHVKGSFTGAVADHLGLFPIADSGTIFLDEIENTTQKLQAKLLRVIETGEIRPVGAPQIRQVDVRVIAASNRDLQQEVETGNFRPDLFYRLNSFPILLPPLRDRPADLLLLAQHFLDNARESLGRQTGEFTEKATEALLAHDWPGNVRELKNVIERAVLLGRDGEPIDIALLPPALVAQAAHARAARSYATSAADASLQNRVASFEREVIDEALKRNDGVMRRAAAELGTSAATLGRKARRYGLWKES